MTTAWGFELYDGAVWRMHEYRYASMEEAYGRAQLACVPPYEAYRLLPPRRTLIQVYGR